MRRERGPGILRRIFGSPPERFRKPRRTSRKLGHESLESRMLLSANSLCFQNFLDPEDVTFDGAVTPQDVVVVINQLNDGGEGEAVTAPTDVNGDGQSTAADALLVINRLNGNWSADRTQAHIDRIQSAIDNGTLPEGVTVEQAAARLAALENALVTGERPEGQCLEGVERLEGIGGLMAHGGNGSDFGERMQAQIDRLQSALANGTLPDGVTAEQVAARLDALQNALATGERPESLGRPEGVGGPLARGGHGGDSAVRMQAQIEHLQSALANGTLPDGVTAEQATARLDALQNALATGERPDSLGRPEGVGGPLARGGHGGDSAMRMQAQSQRQPLATAGGKWSGGMTGEQVAGVGQQKRAGGGQRGNAAVAARQAYFAAY